MEGDPMRAAVAGGAAIAAAATTKATDVAARRARVPRDGCRNRMPVASRPPSRVLLLRKDCPAARAAALSVLEAQLARTNRAGGAAGPEALPETLDQDFQRRAHGADGSGRPNSRSLLAPPDLRPG